MAVEVSSWVWNHSRCRNGARLVLLAIADCARADGSNAFPSNAELMRKAALSERGVQTGIAKAVELGELQVELNAGPGGCNRYRVVMTPADSAPPQILRPAKSAKRRKTTPQQVAPGTPAESAPPANAAPPQNLRQPPAESAPGTVIEPSVTTTTSSTAADAAPDRSESKAAKTKPRPAIVEPTAFAVFWGLYPRKEAKGDAEKAWSAEIRHGANPQAIIDGASLYAIACRGRERAFIKLPGGWLRDRRWEDDTAPPPRDPAPAETALCDLHRLPLPCRGCAADAKAADTPAPAPAGAPQIPSAHTLPRRYHRPEPATAEQPAGPAGPDPQYTEARIRIGQLDLADLDDVLTAARADLAEAGNENPSQRDLALAAAAILDARNP